MNAQKQAMDDREDFQDGDINEPEQPAGNFDDNIDIGLLQAGSP